jgi:hypothetical protein
MFKFCDFVNDERSCLKSTYRAVYAIDLVQSAVRKFTYETNSGIAVGFEELNYIEEEYMTYLLVHIRIGLSTNNVESQSTESIIESQPSFSGHCGSPGTKSYPWSPEQLFSSACAGHDTCYSSFVNKSSCDRMFYNYMERIARNIALDISFDFPVSNIVAYAALNTMAPSYKQAVVIAGLDPYCANKGTICHAQNGEMNVTNDIGTIKDGFVNDGLGTLFQETNPNFCFYTTYYQVCTGGAITGEKACLAHNYMFIYHVMYRLL